VKICRLLRLLGTFCLVAVAAQAQFTWTGAGADTNLTTPGNWLGGVAPTGSGTENLVFGDSPRAFVTFPTTFAVNNVSMTASSTGYFLGNGGDTLTLNGNVYGAIHSSPFLVFLATTFNLSAGSHQFDAQGDETGGSDLYVFGNLAGSGQIVKTGTRSLIVSSTDGASTYTGNIDLQSGTIAVAGDGALGTGVLTLSSGKLIVAHYDLDRTVTLENSLILTSSSSFGNDFNKYSLLKINGSVTGQTGVTAINLGLEPGMQLTFAGNVGENTAGSTYTLSGGGVLIFSGASQTYSYTGGTIVVDGVLIFGHDAPTTGLLKSVFSGYIGTYVYTNVQSNFLAKFDGLNTTGVIGFDSPDPSDPTVFSENINLTGINASARIGSATNAVLSGTITPQASTYMFGGRGILEVTSNLTDGAGAYDVYSSDPLQLFLSGTNTYSGATYVDTGAIIFAGPSSLSPSTLLQSNTGGYIGQTENLGMSAAAFISQFDTTGTYGVIGFDAASALAGRVVTDNIDLAAAGLYSTVFLGTSTAATLQGTITPAGSSYNFTGFRDGRLTVESTLSDLDLMNPRSVVIGMSPSDIHSIEPSGVTFRPTVTLTAANTYTGGTTIQSGQLAVGNNSALGTGTVTVASVYGQTTGLSASTSGIVLGNAFDFGYTDSFTFGGGADFTLSGNLTGSSAYTRIVKVDLNTVTLTGDNTGLLTGFEVQGGGLIFGSDTAAGVGLINLLNNDALNGSAKFTSAAPVMGSLQGQGNTTVEIATTGNLVINQQFDQVYDGTIFGTGGLTKTGTSTLTLNGNNTYAGPTRISAGTLVAGNNSAFGTGTVILNGGVLSIANGVTLGNPFDLTAGGFLGGSGTFGSHITAGTGVVLSPGNSPGTLTFASGLTLAPGGEYDWQLQTVAGGAGTSTGWDLISVSSGTLDLSTLTPGSFTLKLLSLNASGTAGNSSDFNSTAPFSFTIATAAGGIVGFNATSFTIDATGFLNFPTASNFSLSVSGNNLNLNFTPVPEPSTYVLLGVGLGALFAAVRRRRA